MQPTLHIGDSLQTDPRWQLVQRVIASPAFARSARLSEFLLFVSEATLLGQAATLNEQEIGVKVFGRTSGYLQSDDNIVRSNASRLRQRLDEYFADEGQSEQLRITLPKGRYVPEFTNVRISSIAQTANEQFAAAAPTGSTRSDAATPSALASTSNNKIVVGIGILVLLCSALAWIAYKSYLTRWAKSDLLNSPSSRLWANIFDAKAPTLLVPADSSLVLYETLTHHEVPLAAYINGDYRVKSDDGTDDLTNPKGLAQRRLTSMADLDFVAALGKQSATGRNSLNIRYARDLQIEDVKSSTLILLGARESNPWVTLFDDERNFSLTSDQTSRISTIRNQRPLKNEFETLQSHPDDPQHRVYALVANIPNRSDDKHVLILEGTTIAGTEAAADFILDSVTMDALLAGHIKPGQRIPYFELVLEAKDFSGTAPRARVIASRFW